MFQAGKPVTGSDFIGRKEELELVQQYMEIGQSVALIAPRRFGKTSLVKELINKTKQSGNYTGIVDVFSCPDIRTLSQNITGEVLENHKLKQLFNNLKGSALQMIKSVEFKSVIDSYEFLIGYSDTGISDWELLANSISFVDVFATQNNKKMVFGLDEIGDISKYAESDAIVKLLRSEIQKQERTTYIFSGSYESAMDAMFVNDKSPFYRMVRIVKLGYLPFGETYEYMSKKLKKYDVEIEKKLLEDAIDFLKGHPYYCQLALQQLYLFKTIKKKTPTLEELLLGLLAVESSYLERLWEDYSNSMETSFVLRNLVNNPTGIYSKKNSSRINVSRSLSKLEGSGILYKKEKGYYFYDPMFEYYLARMIS